MMTPAYLAVACVQVWGDRASVVFYLDPVKKSLTGASSLNANNLFKKYLVTRTLLYAEFGFSIPDSNG